jgi:hypothetical protein
MNCPKVRELLPLLLYDDIPAAETNSIREHLAECAACRKEFDGLQEVRAKLDAAPFPAVQVNLRRLFHDAAARQTSQIRRWRRLAVAVCGVAAALLFAMVLRLELRVQAHQLVVRWGLVPNEEKSQEPPGAAPIEPSADPAVLATLEERVRLLDELLHAAMSDFDDRDKSRSEAVARLQRRLEEFRIQNSRRWSETERNVAAMYTALFVLPKKGERP